MALELVVNLETDSISMEWAIWLPWTLTLVNPKNINMNSKTFSVPGISDKDYQWQFLKGTNPQTSVWWCFSAWYILLNANLRQIKPFSGYNCGRWIINKHVIEGETLYTSPHRLFDEELHVYSLAPLNTHLCDRCNCLVFNLHLYSYGVLVGLTAETWKICLSHFFHH